jgi:hypothetical protein
MEDYHKIDILEWLFDKFGLVLVEAMRREFNFVYLYFTEDANPAIAQFIVERCGVKREGNEEIFEKLSLSEDCAEFGIKSAAKLT